jgi:hypothetical protein
MVRRFCPALRAYLDHTEGLIEDAERMMDQ